MTTIESAVEGRLAALQAELVELGAVVVAFSGGADSALLAAVAHATLGPDKARIVTAISPSLADSERADAEALATELGWSWQAVETDEMENAAYRHNGLDRCFYCKDALMDALEPIAARIGATVVLGVNVDDLGDHRPGQRAAASRGAVFPMVKAGLSKAEVRAVSRHLGIRTWDKPAAACLSSRLPYGIEVSIERLTKIQQAEAGLRALGFASLRVRHYEELARIEVPLEDLGRVVELRDEVVDVVAGAGYRYVTLDLQGLRSGNLNPSIIETL